MRKNELVDIAKFVRDERKEWENSHLIAPSALRDFQKLSDETFLLMRRKYFSPADLVAEMKQRRASKVKPPRKQPMRQAD
jgi:hypothetical protein